MVITKKISIIVFSALSVCGATAETISIQTTDLGWYKSGGTHNANNVNTYTGSYYNNEEYRSFYLWDLPSFDGNVVSARLIIDLSHHSLGTVGDDTQLGSMFDVSNSHLGYIRNSNGDGHGVDIFNDLGSGINYGQFTISDADSGWVSYDLNAMAVADINAKKGDVFAMGIDNASVSGYGSGYFLLSSGSVRGTQNLVLEVIPEPMTIAFIFTALALFVVRRNVCSNSKYGTGKLYIQLNKVFAYFYQEPIMRSS